MAINCPVLYNNALNGAVAGFLSGRAETDVITADYTAYVAAAVTYATVVDALAAVAGAPLSTEIGKLISAAGVTQVPASAAQANASQSLPNLVFGLSLGVFSGRGLIGLNAAGVDADTLASTYTLLAGAVVVQLESAVASYSNT